MKAYLISYEYCDDRSSTRFYKLVYAESGTKALEKFEKEFITFSNYHLVALETIE